MENLQSKYSLDEFTYDRALTCGDRKVSKSVSTNSGSFSTHIDVRNALNGIKDRVNTTSFYLKVDCGRQ